MNELALFAGAGGGIFGGTLLGWRTVCAVELDTYAASVLLARQNDGILPPFPVWDDIRTFDGKPWRGLVDVVSGGFPCQDISCAGKGKGIEGERSGLWREMARVVREVEPGFVFVENRDWYTAVRGPVLMHAGKKYDDSAIGFIEDLLGKKIPDNLPRGGIVGVFEIIDCVNKYDSPWFFGYYGFILKNAVELPFMPCRGQLGFFEVDYRSPS